MNPKIQCSECGMLYDNVKVRRRVLKGLAYEFYWMCSSCDHKHISYYTDKKIRRDIKRQVKRRERYQKAGTEEQERKLLAEINMNDKLIKKDMDALKERMQREVV